MGGIEAFHLGEWRVEPAANALTRAGEETHLEPKAMAVLVCLVEHAGRVVTRRALFDRVWAADFIADSTLTHTVADIRRALGDDPRSPRFIETIPKNGYRLVVDPSEIATRVDPSSMAQRPLAVVAGDRVLMAKQASPVPCEHVLHLGDREVSLVRDTVIFGRDGGADIQILNPEASRRHARLDIGRDGVFLEDLGSKNGTQVNSRGFTGRCELATGDVIEVGKITMTYRCLSDALTKTQDPD